MDDNIPCARGKPSKIPLPLREGRNLKTAHPVEAARHRQAPEPQGAKTMGSSSQTELELLDVPSNPLNRMIIKKLQDDGRASFAEIARSLFYFGRDGP